MRSAVSRPAPASSSAELGGKTVVYPSRAAPLSGRGRVAAELRRTAHRLPLPWQRGRRQAELSTFSDLEGAEPSFHRPEAFGGLLAWTP